MAAEALLSLAFPEQRRPPLHVAQVHVVAQGAPGCARANRRPAPPRLRVVPARDRVAAPPPPPSPPPAIGGHLVKTSASGPIPTSEVLRPEPLAISTRFTSAAASDPGTQVPQPLAHHRAHPRPDRLRAARFAPRRAPRSPARSCSRKGHPAGLHAWRSQGASSRSASGGSRHRRRSLPPVLAAPRSSPVAERSPPPPRSREGLTVGQSREVCPQPPPRPRTTDGPPPAPDAPHERPSAGRSIRARLHGPSRASAPCQQPRRPEGLLGRRPVVGGRREPPRTRRPARP
jgi:hypothetical protein